MVDFEALKNRETGIGVVGLGYVGLPLAVHLARHFAVTGFDVDPVRIRELAGGTDRTREVTDEELASVDMAYTGNASDLAGCGLIIVAVPTPIDAHRIPDLGPVRSASRTVGANMRAGACVVFESTVYPGVTEEVCVPILVEESGLRFGEDFTVGYSPERINPGDKVHTIDKVVKVVSGSDERTGDMLAKVYGSVVMAGIHLAPTIKVAEAAKVIENTQRDLNIALMNELSMIFDKMGIDTRDVLEAAGTKWNFLPFSPGLVGGHCIGVDPYYLTFKAESLGYHPEMILAGRRINDGMGKYVVEQCVKMLIADGVQVRGARAGVLGLTFKEDVPDLRNTRVVDIIRELGEYGMRALVHDPMADPAEARHYYGLDLVSMDELRDLDTVIVAVAHRDYREIGIGGLGDMFRDGSRLMVDVKGAFNPAEAEGAGLRYWRL
ncbi:MAG: nucleotide sugar dehydrogenase [Desulfatibacillaceae bacterium]